MIYVIGSGPSGISCAQALLKQGLVVTMLDSGIELESHFKEAIDTLKNSSPEGWDKNSLKKIKQSASAKVSGTFVKSIYGSLFPYKEVDKYFQTQVVNAQPRISLAKGGLSNVWGAAVLPFIDEDITDWPISIKDLIPHYESIFSFMDLAAINDDLATKFPLYTQRNHPLQPSNQSVSFMNDLLQNKSVLNSNGFLFGNSRLAIRSYNLPNKPGCIYCGLCLYGCPHELIYNSAFTLNELIQHENFHYIKDIIVQRISETNIGISIAAISRHTGELITFRGDRVYLACGVIPTAKIMLESLEAYDKELIIKDSQWFMIPLMRYKNTQDVADEKLYTLSQMFIELFDSTISKNTISFQVYTYNDLLLSLFQTKPFSFIYPLIKAPANMFLGRMLIVMGYLHSNISSNISLRLQKNTQTKINQIMLNGNINKGVQKTINLIYKKLFDNQKCFKALPIPGITKTPNPGYGSHSGGTFPMRETPHGLETDILGRPYGFKKIHIVDSSIFPSIPATTITLTIMANAHRIASRYNDI